MCPWVGKTRRVLHAVSRLFHLEDLHMFSRSFNCKDLLVFVFYVYKEVFLSDHKVNICSLKNNLENTFPMTLLPNLVHYKMKYRGSVMSYHCMVHILSSE